MASVWVIASKAFDDSNCFVSLQTGAQTAKVAAQFVSQQGNKFGTLIGAR